MSELKGFDREIDFKDVEDFVRRHDSVFGGRLSRYINYSRLVSLTWFEKCMEWLSLQEHGDVCVVSGSEHEPELALMQPASVEVLSFEKSPEYDLDKDWRLVVTRTYDFVLCNQVLEHVFNPVQAFENLVHLTKPGGLIFVSIPTLNCIHGEPFFFYSGMHPRFLSRLGSENGLEIVGLSSWGAPKYAVNCILGKWLTFREMLPAIPDRIGAVFPLLSLLDGRRENALFNKLHRIPKKDQLITDCWALFRKPVGTRG